MKILIINLDNNNIFSLVNAFHKLHYKPEVFSIYSSKKQQFKNADVIILPGVGNFSFTMKKIKRYGLDDLIYEYVLHQKKKLVGICLGMQLLFEESTETKRTKGLSLIEGKVIKFNNNSKINISNIGWNKIEIKKNISNFFDNKYFYFVHRYHCAPKEKRLITSTFKFIDQNICASIEDRNIIGLQFHPEKSGKLGLLYLKSLIKTI